MLTNSKSEFSLIYDVVPREGIKKFVWNSTKSTILTNLDTYKGNIFGNILHNVRSICLYKKDAELDINRFVFEKSPSGDGFISIEYFSNTFNSIIYRDLFCFSGNSYSNIDAERLFYRYRTLMLYYFPKFSKVKEFAILN